MILDGVVAFLLFVTILYCWRLSRKISSLNSSRKELQSLISEFGSAISRAESSITTLKTLSQEADEQLQRHIEKARFLTNDLAFLAHKGENVADRLASQISGLSRASQPREIKFTGNPKQQTITPSVPTQTPERKAQETELQKGLGWRKVNNPAPKPAVAPITKEEMAMSKKKALEEVLEQIAARKRKTRVDSDQPGILPQSAQTQQDT